MRKSVLWAAMIVAAMGLVGCAGQDRDTPSHAGGTPPEARSPVAWNQMERGMTPDQVLQLLGKPLDVRIENTTTTWHYARDSGGPWVRFTTREMEVTNWKRPGR